MKENLRTEIERSIQKVLNQKNQIEEITSKLDKLQAQISSINSGIQKEEKRIVELGLKQSRRDGKAETPEETQKKKNFNDHLRLEKLELIKKILTEKNIYQRVEELLPDIYKDINLD